jgi:hypothetical protein
VRRLLLALALLTLALPASAAAQEMSANVQRIATIPEMRTAIAINFIGDTMFVSTTTGLFSYDVSDPAAPKLLGALPMYIWENEDMDVDTARERVFISRDPRGFTSPATSGATFPFGAVHVVDVSDPRVMKQVGFFLVPAGHTTTCVNDCDVVWTSGPYANAQTQPGFVGRPIYATDVTDPANPKPCPAPIDTGRNDGVTDYVHDVQVDSQGVAWVAGAGGVRGYLTSGEHRNPLTGQLETATGCAPIPYAGSGTPSEATPSRFMHNSFRASERDETVLYGTEENLSSNCRTSGRFVTYDLTGTFDGEGWRDIAETKHRMQALDTWTPEGAEGATACASAHYFADRGDGLFANAFYGQGIRFLDVTDPTDIRQVGWHRPSGTNAWAAYWHKGLVFVADNGRGVDVLRFAGDPAESRTRRAPALKVPAVRLRMDGMLGGLCPLPSARA